ncbi:exodeoxyribonuclease VII large subunit [Flintibacter muris]|uniref:exodeoxyribonuclease VII large subunit n=1 Tax=Flintibacter muris TaxID=2941327 RepID=UPI00203DD14E|nr:exodeoxyribonuclease VII large subunit [Flintibacter muris]
MREDTILTPSQVGQYLKNMMDRDRLLSGLLVRGELSNYKMYPSGHHYFTLKDGEGALRCVMFRGDAQSLRFRPQNGMQVIAAGRVTVFPRDGQYQLYCARLTPEGVGDLALAFEQLKTKLAQEGLFDPAHKQDIPEFPEKIALVTSPAGAAVRDMIRILGARWPLSEIKVIPVRVQGAEAPGEIAAAIRWADAHRVADLIITGRGGGSMEDLWAFNEEVVARAIYDAQTPIISAVGHEPDVTIADFVADLRASTPSNAAELAVPDQNDIYAVLLGDRERLEGGMSVRLARYRQALDRLAASRPMTEPASYFREKRLLLDYQSSRLAHGLRRCASGQRERLGKLSNALPGGAERVVAKRRERLKALAASLDAMSPLKVLGRGYSIARREDGKAIVSIGDVSTGDKLKLTLADGNVDCQVL